MDQIVNLRPDGRMVPPDVCRRFEEVRNQGWRWGPAFLVTQELVNRFTHLTGDENPLHRPGPNSVFEGPIVPGLFLLAYIPSLIPDWNEIFEIPGFAFMVTAIERLKFSRPIEVSGYIQARWRAREIKENRLGITTTFEFVISREGDKHPALVALVEGRYCQKGRTR